MQFRFRDMMFISLLLGMVAGTYGIVTRPHAREREQLLAQIYSMDNQITAIGDSTDGIDGVANHINQQKQAVAFFQSRLPKEADIQKVIDEIVQTAAANSLQSGEVRILDRQQTDGVCARPVHMQFTGNFNGFYSFLLQLEQMHRVMKITQLDMAGGGDQNGQVRAELTLTIYCDSGVPVSSPAASTSPPDEIESRQIVANYLTGERRNDARFNGMLHDTDKLMQECLAAPDAQQVSLVNLRSDPFRAGQTSGAASHNAGTVRAADGDRVAMLRAIEKLQLQSIVSSGDRPACMIDNHLYREGEQLDTFTVERIEQAQVVVRNGSYRFELKISG
jgi:type IV pilus assembly protein PilO